jgi:hypothetical protein
MSRKENGIYVVSDKLNVERYNIEGNIYRIIEELQNIRKMAMDMGMVGEGNLDIITDNYYGDIEIVITYYFDRVENEKEKATREKAEAKVKKDAAAKRKATAEAKKLKNDNEYSEFLRLKEKFGAI